MRWTALIAVLASALLAAAPGEAAKRPPPHRADGKLSDWRGKPGYIAGRSVVSKGELISTDYLYDDYGGDLDNSIYNGTPYGGGSLALVRGDYRYPPDERRYGNNAADLREVRLAWDRRGLHVAIHVQTMKVRDAAIVTLGLDGDSTQAREWPGGSGITASGADRFVTTWGTGARLDGAGAPRALRSAVNLAANAIEVDVPRNALAGISRRPRVWIVAGVHAGDGVYQEPQPGRPAAFDAGFKQVDSWPRFGSSWGDNDQSRILALGDVTSLAETLDLGSLAGGRSARAAPLPPGFYNRIFRSSMKLGEGRVPAAPPEGADPGRESASEPDPQTLSPWQPYGLYIPPGYSGRKRAPLTLVGHSLGQTHNQYKVVSPRLLEQLGGERGSIIVTPLARSVGGWYLDAGLVDVLEVLDDVSRHYAVDDERVAISGYSMGGYMTYRLGLLMPDRFSRASAYVGPPAYYFWPYPAEHQSFGPWRVAGNTNLIVENARNLPYEMTYSTQDELVPIGGALHQIETFRAHGNPYRAYIHPAGEHFTRALTDDWAYTRDWLGNHARQRNPVEVVYKRYPAMDLPRRGLVFDGAYWVDGIVVRDARDPTSFGLVEATTLARGGERSRPELETPGATAAGGIPATTTGQSRLAGEPIRRENAFEAKLRNIARVTFRTAGMGLSTRRRAGARIETDGPVSVRLAGVFPRGARALLDGRRLAVTRSRLSVSFSVPAGRHTLTVLR